MFFKTSYKMELGRAATLPCEVMGRLAATSLPPNNAKNGEVEMSDISEGQKIRLLGFHRGSSLPVHREGMVLMKRPGEGSWIVKIEDTETKLEAGLAGGAVFSHEGEALGIATTSSQSAYGDAVHPVVFDFVPVPES